MAARLLHAVLLLALAAAAPRAEAAGQINADGSIGPDVDKIAQAQMWETNTNGIPGRQCRAKCRLGPCSLSCPSGQQCYCECEKFACICHRCYGEGAKPEVGADGKPKERADFVTLMPPDAQPDLMREIAEA